MRDGGDLTVSYMRERERERGGERGRERERERGRERGRERERATTLFSLLKENPCIDAFDLLICLVGCST